MAFDGTLARLLLCAGAAACCAPASADVHGTARLGDVGFMLADLDPGDGIAPSLTLIPDWLAPYSGMAQIQYMEYARNGTDLIRDGDGLGSLDSRPLSVEYRRGEAYSFGSLTGREVSIEQVLSSETHLPVGNTSLSASQTIDSDRIAFSLSPNTAVTFFAKLEARGSASQDGMNSFSAYASLRLWVESGWTTWDMFDSAELATSEGWPTLDDSAYLFASYAHRSSEYMRGNAELRLGTGAHTLAPIPEPSQWAMLAGGTLLFAAGATRRRSRKQAP